MDAGYDIVEDQRHRADVEIADRTEACINELVDSTLNDLEE